ncbi:hypothetical protein JVT61DRAFT_6939 [Boletus reticuloceps]|uniref:Uncharacterized protein n=1 Tax=Boletus reticuloceps TaxID=495285 RepID=A0A8I3A6A6_9AGAM|nr:hypothetical protein JVT61DRAFT_6939 [Boletus reticuloceps]
MHASQEHPQTAHQPPPPASRPITPKRKPTMQAVPSRPWPIAPKRKLAVQAADQPNSHPVAQKIQPQHQPPLLSEIQAQVQNLQPPQAGKATKTKQSDKTAVKPWLVKPKDSTGCASPAGYKIQLAMGLADNRRLYNAFCEAACLLAIEHLDIKQMIREQEKYKISMVLVKAQNMFPYLQYFINNWPFYDLIAQYLWN